VHEIAARLIIQRVPVLFTAKEAYDSCNENRYWNSATIKMTAAT